MTFDIFQFNWQSQGMNWPRSLTLIILTVFILVTVAIQTEKPAMDLTEIRPDRLGTHFRKVAFAPNTQSAWGVGFGGTVLRTDDAGETWKRQSTGTNARLYGLQVLDIHTLFCCGSDGTLLATSNGGKSWQKIPVPTRFRLLDVFFSDATTGWVVGDNGSVLRTSDGGKNWTAFETGLTSGFRRVWFKDKEMGFISGYDGVLLMTDDGGQTWNNLPLPGSISFYGSYFSADGKRHVMVGSCGMIVESLDGGRTWDQLPIISTNFLRDVDFDSMGYGCAVGYGVTLSREPQAENWKKGNLFPGLIMQSVALGPDGLGIAVGHWGAVLTTRDHGLTWRFKSELFAPDLHDVVVDDRTGTVIAAGADGWTMMKQPDSQDWMLKHTGSRATLRRLAIDQKGRVWALGGYSRNVFRHTDQTGWQRTGAAASLEVNLNDITFFGESSGFIVGDAGTILATYNSGDTWVTVTGPTRENINGIYFINELSGYLIGGDGVIMETKDGGASWLGHYTGVTHPFYSGTFSTNKHALVLSTMGALESWSCGHNSSWFDTSFDIPVTAVAPGCRYLGLLNGDVLDRRTGISRAVSKDTIFSLEANEKGTHIWGVGRFGRVIRLTTGEVNLLLQSDRRE